MKNIKFSKINNKLNKMNFLKNRIKIWWKIKKI